MTFSDLFRGIFDSSLVSVIEPCDFLLCLGVSLLAGLIMALTYVAQKRYTKSFVLTLFLLPAVVCVVIMMVNGNVGTGVAVAGAFSLVRFRSVPGSAKEIAALFLAMGAGLIAGMGYLAYTLVYSVLLCAAFLLFYWAGERLSSDEKEERLLSVTVPEDLNYTEIFEDLFTEYTRSCQLVKVKTTNMGSLFRLSYELRLKDGKREKEFIDALRCRNGNLEITLSRREMNAMEL